MLHMFGKLEASRTDSLHIEGHLQVSLSLEGQIVGVLCLHKPQLLLRVFVGLCGAAHLILLSDFSSTCRVTYGASQEKGRVCHLPATTPPLVLLPCMAK